MVRAATFSIIEEYVLVKGEAARRLSNRRIKSQTSRHASATEGPEAILTSEGREPSPMVLAGGTETGKQRV